jgi:hypothetical protein
MRVNKTSAACHSRENWNPSLKNHTLRVFYGIVSQLLNVCIDKRELINISFDADPKWNFKKTRIMFLARQIKEGFAYYEKDSF